MGKAPSEKLKEAVHFVCRTMATRPDLLGAVKLQKILWYFDVRAYVATGQTATGAVFVKGLHGPYTPEVDDAISQLVSEGRFFADTDTFFDNEKARLIGKGETRKSLFTDRELRWLAETTKEICEDHSATSIRERLHGPVWRMARFGEVIPFEATAVTLVRPSTEALELAKKDLGLAR
jgi:hypothetical protein